MKLTSVGTHYDEILNLWLKCKLSEIPNNWRILDAGAGECQFKKYCNHLNYVSQDVAEYDGKGDGKGLHPSTWEFSKLDIVSDINSIPLPDKSFDAIMCTEVFEHIPNPILAIKEFARLLKDGAFLIITSPFTSMTHFAPFHYYSGFNHYFYEKYLPENGFEILEIKPNGNYFEFIALELRRISLITEKFTNDRIKFLERLALLIIKLMLQRFSKKDNGSSEIYNLGYMILAKKI